MIETTEIGAAPRQARSEALPSAIPEPPVRDIFAAIKGEWRLTYLSDCGKRREETAGRTFWEAYPALTTTPFETALRSAAAPREATSFESHFPPWNCWVETRLYPTADGWTLFITDVTGRHRMEERLAAQHRTLEALAVGMDMRAILHLTTQTIERFLPGSKASVLLADADASHLTCGAAASLPDAYNAAIEGIPIGEGIGSCGTAAFRRAPVIVTDIQNDPLWREFRALAASHHLAACWSHPILAPDERLLGTFAIYFAQPRKPSSEELALLEEAARVAGIAIHRRQTDDALRSTAELDAFRVALNDTLRVLADPEQIQAEACRLLGERIGADRTYYVEVDGSANIARISQNHLRGDSPSLVGTYPLDDFEWILARLRTGQEIIEVASQVEGAPASGRAALAALCIDAYVAVPVIKESQLVGALCVTEPRPRVWQTGEVAFVRETAERVWAAVERSRVQQALRDADRRKDEFLAMLAHELRNPLAPIRNAAHVLKLVGAESPDQRWAREVVERQTQHLTRLVDDLLDVSRITRGLVTLRLEPVELSDLIQRAVETSRPVIDGRGHRLSVTLPSQSIFLQGDMIRLVQVIGNLLTNAARYTDEGGQIHVLGEMADGQAVIRVRDNGMGISPELLPVVFDLFAQGHRGLDRSQGGLGIGLTLVRRLVEMHGGTVVAHSDGPGSGSEFVVRLPAVASAVQTPLTDVPGTAVRPSLLQALRVLIVEDNADSAHMLSFVLRHAGHDVRIARDGATALQYVREFQPEVVLCDIGLPGMDGYNVAAKLRAQVVDRQPSLIALTGYGQEEDRQRAKDAGFDYHLTKPVEPDALEALLRSLRPAFGHAQDAADPMRSAGAEVSSRDA